MTRVRQTVAHLPAEQLTANPANVREQLGNLEDLARSIVELGVLEPLLVTEHPAQDGETTYLLLDGHRRLSAGLRVGLASFPVIIRHDVSDPAEQTVTMLATDVHKKAFTPMERARAYGYLRDEEGLTGAEIARRVGVSSATVAAYLNLLHLDGETAEKVDAGDIPVTQAVAAVVETRQTERVAAAKPLRGRPEAYVSWFGESHRLRTQARALCTHRERMQVGSIACGPCWEQVIAEAYAADFAAAAAAAAAAADVDQVLVHRIITGEWQLAAETTTAEKHAVVDAWVRRGGSRKRLAELTGWKDGRYGSLAVERASNQEAS